MGVSKKDVSEFLRINDRKPTLFELMEQLDKVRPGPWDGQEREGIRYLIETQVKGSTDIDTLFAVAKRLQVSGEVNKATQRIEKLLNEQLPRITNLDILLQWKEKARYLDHAHEIRGKIADRIKEILLSDDVDIEELIELRDKYRSSNLMQSLLDQQLRKISDERIKQLKSIEDINKEPWLKRIIQNQQELEWEGLGKKADPKWINIHLLFCKLRELTDVK